MILKGRVMVDFGILVLIIFTVIKVLFYLSIGYLIFYEIRKLKRRKAEEYRETNKDANGKNADNHSGDRD